MSQITQQKYWVIVNINNIIWIGGIELKKITVIIPDETYKMLEEYCHPYPGCRFYFRSIINLAIIDYCRKNTANSSSNKEESL